MQVSVEVQILKPIVKGVIVGTVHLVHPLDNDDVQPVVIVCKFLTFEIEVGPMAYLVNQDESAA